MGCSEESFAQIKRDIEDPMKKRKSEQCAARALERKAAGLSTFSHRCGRHGYDGVIRKFEIAFDRAANISELQYARTHGLEKLLLKTRLAREGRPLQPSTENSMSDTTTSSKGSSSDDTESSDGSECSLRGDSELEHSV
ncbi:hypothetical protein M758_UG330200 [Ceratodon purpureus]|nr:hypothetical protein M758_UG330200 [Ceratodon purpureus]